MSEKYIKKLITFKNDERTIFNKKVWEQITNVKSKVDVLLNDTDMEALENASLYNASAYLKWRYIWI